MPDTSGRYARPSSPPVGIAYLATFLRNKGHDVKVLDLRIEKEKFDCLNAIKKFDPEMVGISFMSYGYKQSYRLIDEIKTELGKTVVIGGAHPSTLREEVLRECKADFAIYGEGELTLSELIEGQDPSGIEGIIWRDGTDIVVNPPRQPMLDLDSLPFPDYEMFEMDRYAQKRIPLNTARGCPHLCTYCAVDLVIGRRLRARSPGNVVDEIESWYSKGYRNFGFNDSTFTENMKRAGEIADEMVRRNIEIEWDLRTGIRVDRVNRELLRKLKRAGCNFIAFGIESIDPEVIRLMRKKTTFEMVNRAVHDAKECGLGVGGFFMIGTPGDTYEKFRETYSFADQEVFDEVRFYNTEPYPGTELFEWIKENGKFLAEPEEYLNSRSRWEEEPIFETGGFSAKERKKAFNEGEFLVAKKLIVKVLGEKAGFFIYTPCRIKFVRKMVLFLGFRMAPLIFKFMSLKKKDRGKETKGAWRQNWEKVRMQDIMEIFDYPRVKKSLNILKDYLPEKGPVLEAGCGLGPWVIKLGELGYDVVGIDYQEECIEKMKSFDERQPVYAADVRKIPFADKSFKAYLSLGVIEHFPEGPDAAIGEAYRVLDEGGRLLLTVPCNNIFVRLKSPLNLLKRNTFIRKLFGKGEKDYYYQRYFKTRELEKVISKNGFLVEHIIPMDHTYSLLEFSDVFRDKKSYDRENRMAAFLSGWLEKALPWASAGSILVVGRKKC